MIYNLKNGIKNLATWFKVIWNDQWWDGVFFFIIMQKKLVLMEKNFRKDGYHVGNEKIANKIKLCIDLTERIINDNYGEQAFKNFDKKWGKSKIIFSPTENRLEELVIKYPNVKNKHDEELKDKELSRCFKHEENQRKQDINLLFKILKENIEYWWD